jgi:hypothetical protein
MISNRLLLRITQWNVICKGASWKQMYSFNIRMLWCPPSPVQPSSNRQYQLYWDVSSDQAHKIFIVQLTHSQLSSHDVTQTTTRPTSLVKYVNIGFTCSVQRDCIARLPAIIWNSLHGIARSYSFTETVFGGLLYIVQR